MQGPLGRGKRDVHDRRVQHDHQLRDPEQGKHRPSIRGGNGGSWGGHRRSFRFLGGAGMNHISRIIHATYINFKAMITRPTPKIPDVRYTSGVVTSENTRYSASSMVLLPRLTKQVMRRSNPEQLGMDLRLLM